MIPQHIQELMNAAAGPTGTQSAEHCSTELVAGTDLTPVHSVTSLVYNSTPQTYAQENPQVQLCVQCKRPRDNAHPTKCPICLIDLAKVQPNG